MSNNWSHNIRKLIHKCPLIYKFCLFCVREGGRIAYKRLDKNRQYSDKLREFKGKKQGERCFIVGNGPSLRTEDLEKIKEDCFGTNKIYKIFDKTSWRPRYYVVFDWSGLDNQDADKIDDIDYVFFGDHFDRIHKLHNLVKQSIVVYGNRLLETSLEKFKFSEDIAQGVYIGATVTYACIQMAVYMGYKEIYLLGIDHNYAYIVDKAGNIVKNPNVDTSHFFAENASNAYADIMGMNNAYIAAKKYADSHGVKIINVTRGGSLELFPRQDFDSLFGGN